MKKIFILSVICLMFFACSKSKSEGQEIVKKFTKSAKSNPVRDYKIPYLTDDMMIRFINSLKEEKNPFDVVFKEGGQVRNIAAMKKQVDEFNSFAKKYGFKDYEGYTAVWGRVMAAQMYIFAEGMQKNSGGMLEGMIKNAEMELQKPGLAPEMEKMYEEQIASSKKSLEEMKKSSHEGISEEDLAMVRKYNPQIEEGMKKYKPSK